MAVTAATLLQLALNVASASTTDAGGGVVATTPADGWSLALGAGLPVEGVLLKFVADAAGESLITVLAGDYPLAVRSALGNLAFGLLPNEVRYLVVEGARFAQDDNSITIICVDTGTRLTAFGLPLGFLVGTAVA